MMLQLLMAVDLVRGRRDEMPAEAFNRTLRSAAKPDLTR
jgi:hypothetical protein